MKNLPRCAVSRLSFLLVAAASTAPLLAQVQLVRDIGRSLANGNSDPSDFHDAGSRAFFVATSLAAGREPYVTDGTLAGTHRIADFRPGRLGSDPEVIFASHGQALLLVRPAPGQHEFVSTDGSAQGTRRLGTLGLPDGSYEVAQAGSGLYILQHRDGPAVQCFATDLTPAGTVALPALASFAFALEHSGLAFGFGPESPSTAFGVTGRDLYVSDGTVAGSRVLTTHVWSAGICQHRGLVWFLRAIAGGVELHSTDGTLSGTVNHGSIAGLASSWLLHSPLVVVGDRLAFLADDALWTSDGTVAGTAPLSGLPCDTLRELVSFRGRLYFRAVGLLASTGVELWTSDGTTAGTALVTEINPGPGNGSPYNLTVTPEGLWLGGRPAVGVDELYLCTGPHALQRIDALSGTSWRVVPFAGGLLTARYQGRFGNEPCLFVPGRSPILLGDLYVGAGGIQVHGAARVRDRLFFGADDPMHGRELWTSDGTVAGTVSLDLAPGSASGLRSDPVALGDQCAFVGRSFNEVVVTDGTLAGTSSFVLPTSNHVVLAARGQELFAFDGQLLWRWDTTSRTLQQLPAAMPFNIGAGLLHALPGALVFGQRGGELHGSDGNAPQMLTYDHDDRTVWRVGERLLFLRSGQLFATDGTAAGTVELARYALAAEWGDVETVAHFVTPRGLHRTDGTLAGTVALAPMPDGLTVFSIETTATGVVFWGRHPNFGTELWRYDAATNRIVLAVDTVPGPTSGLVDVQRFGDGDLLLLSIHDPVLGVEPWVSDGTAAGTRLLADVNPGPGSSATTLLGIAGARAFLLGTDDEFGRELRTVSLAAAGVASVQRMQAGCAGSVGVPELSVLAASRLGEQAFGYELERAAANVPAAVLLGSELGRAVVAGCDVAPTGAVTSQVSFTDAAGAATFALPIPNAPVLLGLQLTAQGFGLDGAVARGFAGSNAVFAVVGG